MRKRVHRRSLVGKVIASFFVQRVLPSSSPLAQFQQALTSIVVLDFIWSEPFFCQSGRSDVFIEVGFESLEDAHVIPLGRRGFMGGIDCLTPVVEDNVVLRTDVTRCEVANEADRFGVNRRVSNELSATRSGLPFGKFAAFRSQTRLQCVGWAAPRMTVSQELTIRGRASEDLNRRNTTGGVWSVVVQLHGVTDSQGPEGGIFNFRPMKGRMNHKGAGLGCNDGDGAFRDTILPLGTDAAVPDGL